MSTFVNKITSSPRRFESWLMDAPHSLIAVALVRIIIGAGIFLLVAVSFTNRRYFWGDASGWQDPQRGTGPWGSFPYNFFNPADPDGLLVAKLAVVALLGLFIAFGFFTRPSILVAFFLVASLGGIGPYSADSGDNLVRITLFYLIFTDAGGKWSIDALLRIRFNPRRLLPDWLRYTLHNLGIIAIGAQTIIIYIIAGLTKLRGETWIDGSALYYALNMQQFMPWPALTAFVTSIPWMMMLVSWATVWLQLLFPVLLLNHYTRVGIVVLMMGFHLGIALFMGLGVFSLVMFASDLIFIRDGEFERIRDDWRKLRSKFSRA